MLIQSQLNTVSQILILVYGKKKMFNKQKHLTKLLSSFSDVIIHKPIFSRIAITRADPPHNWTTSDVLEKF